MSSETHTEEGRKLLEEARALISDMRVSQGFDVRHPLTARIDAYLSRAPVAAEPDMRPPDGREAEELRRGIEELIGNPRADRMVPVARLQALMDRVDARDSLAVLEAHDAKADARIAELEAEVARVREASDIFEKGSAENVAVYKTLLKAGRVAAGNPDLAGATSELLADWQDAVADSDLAEKKVVELQSELSTLREGKGLELRWDGAGSSLSGARLLLERFPLGLVDDISGSWIGECAGERLSSGPGKFRFDSEGDARAAVESRARTLLGITTPAVAEGPTTVQESNWRRCSESREVFDGFVKAVRETEREHAAGLLRNEAARLRKVIDANKAGIRPRLFSAASLALKRMASVIEGTWKRHEPNDECPAEDQHECTDCGGRFCDCEATNHACAPAPPALDESAIRADEREQIAKMLADAAMESPFHSVTSVLGQAVRAILARKSVAPVPPPVEGAGKALDEARLESEAMAEDAARQGFAEAASDVRDHWARRLEASAAWSFNLAASQLRQPNLIHAALLEAWGNGLMAAATSIRKNRPHVSIHVQEFPNGWKHPDDGALRTTAKAALLAAQERKAHCSSIHDGWRCEMSEGHANGHHNEMIGNWRTESAAPPPVEAKAPQGETCPGADCGHPWAEHSSTSIGCLHPTLEFEVCPCRQPAPKAPVPVSPEKPIEVDPNGDC